MAGALDWKTQVLPVLEAAYAQLGSAEGFAGEGEFDTDALNRTLGRERHDRQTAIVLRELEHGGFIRTAHERYDDLLRKANVINEAFIDHRTRVVTRINAQGEEVKVIETVSVGVDVTVDEGADPTADAGEVGIKPLRHGGGSPSAGRG